MKFKFQNGVAHLKSAAARFQSPKSGKIELNAAEIEAKRKLI